MLQIDCGSVDSIEQVLAHKGNWANGKNIQVDHLYPTVAKSRWDYENIYGIYLTREGFSWMALWMSVVRRDVLRKRDICYIRPDKPGDVGRVELFTVPPVRERLASSAFIHFFDPESVHPYDPVDVSALDASEKTDALLNLGFSRGSVDRRGEQRPALVDTTRTPRVILLDEWQLVVTNMQRIVPSSVAHITSDAIDELAQHVTLRPNEVGADYLLG